MCQLLKVASTFSPLPSDGACSPALPCAGSRYRVGPGPTSALGSRSPTPGDNVLPREKLPSSALRTRGSRGRENTLRGDVV